MKRVMTGAAIGALSLVLTTGVIAASAPASAASAQGAKAETTQPAQTAAMAPAQKTQSSTTTTRGPAKTGQPNKSCEDLGNQPGRSASAPGSAFNPDGKAGSVYAGEQPQNSRNTASVSQYDVACARPSK